MNAESVLERLEQLGIMVEADGNDVYVNPAARVPDDLWPDLSRLKLDIYVNLMSDRIIGDTKSCDALVNRLRRGHKWISESANRLVSDPKHGAGTMRLPRTMRWTRVWLRLDDYLRQTYGYDGCILGEQKCRDVGSLLCGSCWDG